MSAPQICLTLDHSQHEQIVHVHESIVYVFESSVYVLLHDLRYNFSYDWSYEPIHEQKRQFGPKCSCTNTNL